MKILITESRALENGKPDRWAPFEALGEVAVYDNLEPALLIERAAGVQAIILNKMPVRAEHMAQLPDLKYIGVVATGYDPVDVAAARERGIIVTNVPSYASRAVSQHCVALLLALCRQTERYNQSVQAGRWKNWDFYSYWDEGLLELSGMTYGAIGFGDIGQATARILSAMGMRILAYRRHPVPVQGIEALTWAKSVEEVFAKADVVSLHCPLNAATEGIVNANTLRLMKPTAFLLNTARGGLVKETDLAAALNEGRIAGAGLDVLPIEPPVGGSPLIGARNCIVTPHIAWISQSTLQCLYDTVLGNLRAFLDGKPVNVVR